MTDDSRLSILRSSLLRRTGASWLRRAKENRRQTTPAVAKAMAVEKLRRDKSARQGAKSIEQRAWSKE